VRYRAVIEYDGADFFGWQRQTRRRSIQGVLEDTVAAVAGAPVTVVGAGRTDTGVHATGQVAHFDTDWARAAGELQRAINARLPRDVAVCALAPVAPAFHARHDAIGRCYLYRLWQAPVRSPLARRRALHVPAPLAIDAMSDAAARFVGVYDLATFGRPLTPGGTTIRRIDRCEVRAEGPRVWVEVDGNAFLRHQVRRMVGVLVDVGRGRCEPDAVSRALAGDRGAVRPRRVPPQGLTLVAVRYPPQVDGAPAGWPGQQQGEEAGEDVYAESGRG